MSKIKPTKEHAVKIVELLSYGLRCGLGTPEPGNMCIEAAVCFAMGLPHSDNPPCVHPIVRDLKIRLNDLGWSSNMERANGLRRLAIAQLGSDEIDIKIFSRELALKTVQRIAPEALRAAIKLHPNKNKEHREKMEAAAVACDLCEAAA